MKLKKILAVLCAAPLFASMLSSCAYRADLVQGNYVEQDLVNELSYGMTSEQVRYVLGTPMLIDPYDESKWYYIKFTREGWSDPEISKLVLVFSNQKLVDMTGDYKKPLGFESGASEQTQSPEQFELPE
ncbi:MAG: outer membrane protein assembly factor BamE [Succinivibrio sp.]